MTALSTTVRLMVRPFRGYEDLVREGHPTVVVGMARLLFVIGAFVAITATGRLAPFEVVSGMISFSYVPMLHFVAVAVVVRLLARDVSVRRAYALYAEGYGPWFLFMLGFAGASLFFHRAARPQSGSTPLVMGAFFVWGGVLTYACFRSALGMSRRRAALALLVHYVILTALVLSFFLAAGQLLPIL